MPVFLKRALRISLRALKWLSVALVALLVVALLATAWLTVPSPGRTSLASIISDLASSPDRTVSVSGVSGIWSGRLRLDGVTISDRSGPWLELADIELDWSPTALLSRRFDAELLKAGRVEVLRAPEPGQETAADDSGFSLPVSVDVDRFEFPDIVMGAGLAGEVARLSAAGTARAERDPMAVDLVLDIDRTDGRAGSVDATLAYMPQDNRIDVALKASEPAGGIIAGLLQMAGDPAVDISIDGEGPFADWRGQGRFAVDGSEVAALSLHHRLDGDDRLIEAKGQGLFAPFLPPVARPFLDGPTSFDIAAVLSAAGGVDVRRAVVNSQTLALDAAGTIDPAGRSDFTLAANALDAPVALSLGDPVAPVTLAVRSASARIIGTDRPAIDLTVELPSLSAAGFDATEIVASLQSEAFDLASQTGPFALSAQVGRIASDDDTLAPLLAGQTSLTATGSLEATTITLGRADITNEAASVQASGTVSRSDGSLALDVAADVASSALPPAAQPALGERVTLNGRIERAAEGAFSVSGLDLASGGLAIAGRVAIDGEEIDADISGSLADIAVLSDQASGAIRFSSRATGALSGPAYELSLQGERLESAGRAIEGLDLTASGVADPAAPSADVSLSGSVEGETLRGTAAISTGEQQRSFEALDIVLGQSRITGDLQLDDDLLPTGTLNVSVPDLGPLGALVLEQLSGSLDAELQFTRDGERPRLLVNGRIPAFSRDTVSARDVTIDATIVDYLTTPAISGRVQAALIGAGGTAISGLNLALGRDGPWTAFNLAAEVAGSPASAVGGVMIDQGRVTVELDSAAASLQGTSATLAAPTLVVVNEGTVALDGLVLLVGGGRVTVSGTAGEALSIDAAIASLPLATVNAFAPGLDAAGTLNGRVTVTGAPSNPSIRYTADVAGAAVAASRDAGFGAMAITSSGTFAGGRLQFDASLGDGSGLTLRGGGTVETGGSGALGLQFSGRVPFDFLTARLAAQGLSLTGIADASISVGGSTSNPAISGTVTSSGARFIDTRSGLAVTDLATRISIADNVARIESMTGTLSTGGRLSASGTVGIDAAQGFPADLDLRLDDGRYVDGRLVTASLSGALEVNGPLATAPTVTGTVNLGRTVVTVPERLPGSLNALNVQHRNAPAAVRRQEEAIRPPASSGNSSGGLNLDVTVNAPQEIFVRGRGLDVELGGSLRLTGPVSSPRAIGEFNLRRGRLTILAKRLAFTRGAISFSGSLTPYLDLAADSQAGTTTVTVLVRGPATDPEFTFESSPTLPQDEVLAALVFGRTIDNLSPVQIAQLAAAAAQLAGLSGSTNLLETLRARTGLDDIDVRTDEATGESSVAVGKYLNDRTYLSLERGTEAGSGKAAIDLEIGRGLKLRGEAREDGETKGGIYFEREY